MKAHLAASMVVTMFGLFAFLHITVNNANPIDLQVRPRFGFAPQDVRIIIRLQTNSENREIRVIADGENFYRESRWEVEGAAAPRIYELRWSALPAGSYVIQAAVASRTRVLATAEQHIELIGGGE